ncbi:hypothetical protein ACK2F5_07490 [Clostridioides difficile]|uniref:hypothetical protein n=1 Tax=Clostridioides difficile TaxID=1496 RepID=UPI001F40E8F0|nr:hypothetical protein [Clostridioides difficile]MCI4888166.1 hypothetical protein [Clostridioides difficile]
MNIINKIFWQEDRIGMITNNLEADTHSHCMLQLFLGIEDSIEITVNEKLVKCNCIIVDKNISHSFSARKKFITLLLLNLHLYMQNSLPQK